MSTAILQRKQTHFVLWRPGVIQPPPKLVIGKFKPGAPPTLDGEKTFVLAQSSLSPDVFEIAAADCNLTDGQTYHYWFEITDTNVYFSPNPVLRIADPTACSVDWRLTFAFSLPYKSDPNDPSASVAPASVMRFKDGVLHAADPASIPVTFADQPDVATNTLPSNNRLVIYELPTAWTQIGDLVNAKNVGVGTFRDVLSLVDKAQPGANFVGAAPGHLLELGVNSLELLPPADSYHDRRSWGYGTSNYFAPDFDLGRPLDPTASDAVNDAKAPTAVGDFLKLVRACHTNGIRFIYDAVMAFAMLDPYRYVNFLDLHVKFGAGDPEQGSRNGFGGDLWKYNYAPQAFDPISGTTSAIYLARRHMIAHLLHWMSQYHLDGLRLDSVVNYNSWDFIGELRDTTRTAWNDRWTTEGNPVSGANERFIVIGEELSVPKALLSRLDALWNEDFKRILRKVILGRNADDEPSFEWSVRKLIDCRNLGFSDGAQAVNYVGSHDVGGFGNERLYNYLDNNGVALKEKQIKLAFACLLTAVGIPMILAGDEFADQQDFPQVTDANKEIDPVNFDRLGDPWRKGVFDHVARLVKLRTTADALSVNDTDFIHIDFNDGKRVLAWTRGRVGIDDPVVVVANFSEWGTANPLLPGSEYIVQNWPPLPAGKAWREVTQDRPAPTAGRESIFPWEAKVYCPA